MAAETAQPPNAFMTTRAARIAQATAPGASFGVLVPASDQELHVLSYLSGMNVSTRALTALADALRRHRRTRATRWRKLSAGRQALLVVAYLRQGETYADLAYGFRIGTSTVYRYPREAITLLAAMAPTLEQAIEVASRKAYVILDGTLLRIDRVGMTSGHDRVF
jgi:hypothetical protein